MSHSFRSPPHRLSLPSCIPSSPSHLNQRASSMVPLEPSPNRRSSPSKRRRRHSSGIGASNRTHLNDSSSPNKGKLHHAQSRRHSSSASLSLSVFDDEPETHYNSPNKKTINYNKTTAVSPHLHPNSPLRLYLGGHGTSSHHRAASSTASISNSRRRRNFRQQQKKASSRRRLVEKKTTYRDIEVALPASDGMTLKTPYMKRVIQRPNFHEMTKSLNMQVHLKR